MGLAIRMILYLVFGWLSGQGVGFFDPDGGVYTITVESAQIAVTGLIGFVGTYIASRWAKARGGQT